MKILIVYDSTYGNTEEIARAIGEAITGEVKVLRVGGADPSETFDLLIVGSPTHGGRPTQAIQDFTKRVPALNGAPVAAFDTRLSTSLVKIFGYAAGRIGKTLEKKGGTLVKPPEAFFVKGTKGPLREGELERAASWAGEIAENIP
ncbi:flavodoxin family protein [Candidatus Bathyarchaeota archaeon]|nr:MAG: flavodoxin family protein [Candidatus Bathyarchaeota archaeon]